MTKIIAKTKAELEIMRHAGKILTKAHEAMKAAVKPGVTLLELDKIAEDIIRSEGGVPSFKGFHGFPGTICAMVNDEVVHGIPSDRKIEKGDLLSVDCGVIWKKMHADAAWSMVVGGADANPEREAFQKCVYEALMAGCRAAKTGNHVGDIGHAIEQVIRKGGYKLCKEYTGHGLGYNLHEDPNIFNFGKPKTGPRLIQGMTIAIEPIVAMKKPKVRELDDGWTVVTCDGSDGCQWEHCGVVTPDGLEIFA